MTRFVRPAVLVLALSLVVSAPVHAADPPAAAAPAKAVRGANSTFPIFADFFGSWKGTGLVGGLESKIGMDVTPVADGMFVRLSWKNDMTSKQGLPLRFEGEGTYRPVAGGDGMHRGMWIDSQGKLYDLLGKPEGDSLTTTWGDRDGTIQGRTTYRLLDRTTLHVRDEIRRQGEWVTFGNSTLVRGPLAPAAAAGN